MTKWQDTRWKWLVIAVVAVAAVCAIVIGSLKPQPEVPLTDLSNLDELRARFNHDKGTTRLLLLLSPT